MRSCARAEAHPGLKRGEGLSGHREGADALQTYGLSACEHLKLYLAEAGKAAHRLGHTGQVALGFCSKHVYSVVGRHHPRTSDVLAAQASQQPSGLSGHFQHGGPAPARLCFCLGAKGGLFKPDDPCHEPRGEDDGAAAAPRQDTRLVGQDRAPTARREGLRAQRTTRSHGPHTPLGCSAPL